MELAPQGGTADERRLLDFLAARGYRRDAYLAPCMTRSLEGPIPPPALPLGYTLRDFNPGAETRERAAAAADGFAGMPDPPDWLVDSVGHVVEFRARREFGETDIVAVTDAGEIASHAAVVLDPTTGVGELEHVATRGAHLRPGLARSVSLAGLHHMRDAGMRHAVVRTHADSGSAISLYESVGFRVMDRLFRYVKDV